MQVKGQSSAADKMEVNQAKQEHLLALKGTASVYISCQRAERAAGCLSDVASVDSFRNIAAVPAVSARIPASC